MCVEVSIDSRAVPAARSGAGKGFGELGARGSKSIDVGSLSAVESRARNEIPNERQVSTHSLD